MTLIAVALILVCAPVAWGLWALVSSNRINGRGDAD